MPDDSSWWWRLQALEYLESEVLPFFYSSSGPHGFKAVKRSLSSSDRTRTLRLSSSRSSSTVSEEVGGWLLTSSTASQGGHEA